MKVTLTNGLGSPLDQKRLRVSILAANILDCESLANLLSSEPNLEVIASRADMEFSMACCQRTRPDVFVVDPKCDSSAVSRTVSLALEGSIPKAILLDDRVREGLVVAILPFFQISYLTRQTGGTFLRDAVSRIGIRDQRVFDPEIADRIERTSRGWRLAKSSEQPSVAALTAREVEVLKLLACGNSVKDCAEQLQLSESTVDNHKTRMMKKLRIHKSVELTHLAIRDGVINV